jgi:hypothetical protein
MGSEARTSTGDSRTRRLPVGPELRKLNGWQFRAVLTEGGAERLDLTRS